MQYDGNGPDARLVGFDYYVRTNTGNPPAGFPGNIDWWHHHPWICHRKTDAAMIAFNVTDSTCASQNGVNVNYSNYYMLHVWVLDDMKFIPDVFAGQIPCISGPGGSTTVRDNPDHPCHFGRTGATATASSTGPRGRVDGRPVHGGHAARSQPGLPVGQGRDRKLRGSGLELPSAGVPQRLGGTPARPRAGTVYVGPRPPRPRAGDRWGLSEGDLGGSGCPRSGLQRAGWG